MLLITAIVQAHEGSLGINHSYVKKWSFLNEEDLFKIFLIFLEYSVLRKA